MDDLIHIDFETYSECDLKKEGAYRYSEHPSTEVQCMAVQCPGDDEPFLFTDTDDIVNELTVAAQSGYKIAAWNVQFEYNIIKNVLKLDELLDFNLWVDPMSMAAAMALPQHLFGCGAALRLPKELTKKTRGAYLINKLAVPGKDGKRFYDDEMFAEFCEYCVQDVVAEKTICDMLLPLSDTEREVWLQDMEINQRGIPVDREYCLKATIMFKEQKAVEIDKLRELTKVSNPNSVPQLKAWFEQEGLSLEDMRSPTIKEHIADENIKGDLRKALLLRATSARTPPTKYATFIKKTSKYDSRFRGALTYHGASTGRWSSRGVNFQNLPRPQFKDQASLADFIIHARRHTVDLVYGAMEALCSGIRSAVRATPGHRLLVSDYSSIEARVLAWVSGSNDLLDIFRSHGMMYEHTAAGIFRKRIEDVDDDERFVGKTSVLALGYQGGYRAFVGMAKRYGIDFSESRAKKLVPMWRESNKPIVNLWAGANNAALSAMRNPNIVFKVNRHIAYMYIKWKGVRYLCCRLPSGRFIYYVNPFLAPGPYGETIKYYGNDPNRPGAWVVLDTYGGKLTENFVQAIARDILAEALLRLKPTVYGDGIVLTVHDEIVCELPDGVGSVDEMSEIMCVLPEWAEGLPAGAKGYESERYMK